MTYEQVLDLLKVDPNDDASAKLVVIVSHDDPETRRAKVISAGLNPYLVLTGLDWNEREKALDDSFSIYDQVINTRIYMAPKGAKRNTQDDPKLLSLWGALLKVHRKVTSGPYGTEFIDFTKLPRQTPPTFDERTLGIYAEVNHRCKFKY